MKIFPFYFDMVQSDHYFISVCKNHNVFMPEKLHLLVFKIKKKQFNLIQSIFILYNSY